MRSLVPPVRAGVYPHRIDHRSLVMLIAALLAATALTLAPLSARHARAAAGTLYAITGAGGDQPSGGTGSNPGLCNLYTLDPSDGSVLTGPTAVTINAGATQLKHCLGLAVDPTDGTLYGVINGQAALYADWGNAKLITINPATGAATVIGLLAGTACDNGNTSQHCFLGTGLAFDPFGTLYAWNNTSYGLHDSGLYTVNTSTGLATAVGYLAGCTYCSYGLAIDSTAHAYVAGTWDSNIYKVSHSTGNQYDDVSIGTGSTQQITNSLAFDPSDTLFAGKRTSSGFTLFTLDPSDGTLTSVGSNAVTKIGAIAFDNTSWTAPDSADLSIDKTVDDPTPEVGQTITFTLTVSNDGPDTATNVEVTDQLPSTAYTFVSASGDGTYDDATGVWDIGSINSGADASIDIDATVNATFIELYRNEARITDSDVYDPDSELGDPADGVLSHPGDIFDSVTPDAFDPDEDLAVELTVNGPTRAGGKTKSFKVTITNVGSVSVSVNSPYLTTTVNGIAVGCNGFSKVLAPGDYLRTRCTYSPAVIGFSSGDSVTYEATIDVPLDSVLSNDTDDVVTTAT